MLGATRGNIKGKGQLVRQHRVLRLVDHSADVEHVVVAVAEGRVEAYEELVHVVRREAALEKALKMHEDLSLRKR